MGYLPFRCKREKKRTLEFRERRCVSALRIALSRPIISASNIFVSLFFLLDRWIKFHLQFYQLLLKLLPSSNKVKKKKDTVFKRCFQTRLIAQNFQLIWKRVVKFAIPICFFVFYPTNRSPFQLSSIRPTRTYIYIYIRFLWRQRRH